MAICDHAYSASVKRMNMNSRGCQPTVKRHNEIDPERVEPS